MLKAILTIAMLVFLASAQHEGNGIGKYTRGHSDPKSCLKFFEDILGGTEAPDSCPDDVCECATQGRAQICPEKRNPGDERPPPGPHGPQTFGVHSINCTYHPYGEHPLAWTEQQVTNEVGDFKQMNQHMDSHVGIYTTDLSKYLTKLEQSNVTYPYLSQKVQSEGTTYYSLLMQSCPAFFVEVLSDKAPQEHDTSDWVVTDDLRFDWTDFEASTADKVVKVSRATTMMDEMVHFYTEVIGGNVTKSSTSNSGVQTTIVKLTHADAKLYFVNRPAPSDSKFSVADLEKYVNSVHDKYIKSTNCGFDQYADHHWAYGVRSEDITLSSASKKLEAGGYKYRWFALPRNHHQIYAFDPSGWSFQLSWQPGNDVPSNCASYSAACKSNDGCYGQGLCNEYYGDEFVYETGNDYREFLS